MRVRDARVARPDAGRQAVLGVVGAWRTMRSRSSSSNGLAQHHRAEDLLAHDPHVGLGVGEHRRLDEVALVADGACRRSRPRRLPACPTSRKPVTRSNCSSETSGPICVSGRGRARSSACRPRSATPSTTCRTPSRATNRREPAVQHWPWLKKMRVGRAGIASSRSASGKTMAGDLPPSSSDHLLQVAGRRLDDQLADLGRAGERDLVDVGMRGERGAGGLAEAGDDVDDARREAGLHDQLAEAQRRERRLLGGLQHDGAAGGQRRRELPGRHQQREVPRDDLADDADRLAHRVGVPVAGRRQRDAARRSILRRPAAPCSGTCRPSPARRRRVRSLTGLPLSSDSSSANSSACCSSRSASCPDQAAALDGRDARPGAARRRRGGRPRRRGRCRPARLRRPGRSRRRSRDRTRGRSCRFAASTHLPSISSLWGLEMKAEAAAPSRPTLTETSIVSSCVISTGIYRLAAGKIIAIRSDGQAAAVKLGDGAPQPVAHAVGLVALALNDVAQRWPASAACGKSCSCAGRPAG